MDLNKEQEIVEQAKTNPMAFGQLFDHYYGDIYGYIQRRVADPAIAQDIVAETFFKAYQNINKFKWQGVSICNWFYRIATNEIRMYFRKAKYNPKSLQEMFESEGYEPTSPQDLHQEIVDAQTQVERQALFVDAQAVLVSLPLKYQEVVALRFVERKKISEIALILDKKEGTIKSLISRALGMLRAKLDSQQTQPITQNSINILDSPLLTTKESYEE
ncbi:RNA polymerase sigma factor [Candidatus Saccharibacteria bacterium]|nr:RNA polymerase sigma factor [Candidatus Saccharibacteria bacterium]